MPEWGEGGGCRRTDSEALNQDMPGVQGAAGASVAAAAKGQSERPARADGGEESRVGEADLVRLR